MTQTNNTLDTLKNEVFSYLTHLHNNQIRGFYDWTGYWKRKQELEIKPPQSEYLNELHDYMKSITIEDIVKAANIEGREWLHKYGNYGRGRRSDSQKYASKQAYAHPKSSFINDNFEILQRVRKFVGFYLGIFDEQEVKELIKETKESELNSTFYTHPKSQISNAIFRLEILYSFLKDSPFDALCLAELKELAKMQVEYLKVNENKTLDLPGFTKDITPINEEIDQVKTAITQTQEEEKELKNKLSELRTKAKEVKEKYNVGDFSQSLEYIK